MKQVRTSNECGLFVIINTIRISRNLPVTSPPLPLVASLAHFRPVLEGGHFEEVVKMCLREFPVITGGDGGPDISNVEIDAVFAALGARHVPATFASHLGGVSPNWDVVDRLGFTCVPIWCWNHWIAGVMRDGEMFFMDSSPSNRNHLKLLEVAREIGCVSFTLDSPRQPQRSNQCGLHLIANSILSYFNLHLSAEQFPVLDLDALRGNISESSQIFETIFRPFLTAIDGFQPGDRVVIRDNQGSWKTGLVRSRRRRMVTVEGWIVRNAPVVWSGVVTGGDHLGVVISDARRSLLQTTTPPRNNPNPSTSATLVDIPLPAHYQNLRRNEAPQLHPNNHTLELLSTEVIQFLEQAPISSGFHFSSEGAFPPPHHYKLRDLEVV